MKQMLIRLFTVIVVFITVSVLAAYIFRSNRRSIINNLTKNHIVLRLPKQYMWVGCIGTIVFIVWIIMMYSHPNDTAATWVYLLFVSFMLGGAAFVVAYCRWYIEFFRNQDFFTYRSILGRASVISFNECQACQWKGNHIRLVTSRKTIYIDTMVTNLEFFLSELSKFVVIEGF